MRATGFEPASEEYHPVSNTSGRRTTSCSSVFVMSNHSHGNAQFVLEKALSLGRRAWAESWTSEKLKKRFGEFVTNQRKKRGKVTRIMVEGKAL